MNLYYASSIFLLGTLASADDNQVRRRLAKQSNACILTKNLVHWKGDDMRVEESWQCELLDDDRRNAGQRFVTIEGLNQADYDLTRSGLTSLFVSGAIIGNGKMTVPKGALKQYEKIEPRGPAGKRKSRKNKNKTTNHIGKTKDNQRNLAPVVVDTRKVLAVRVKANDSTTSATLSQLSNEIFGTSGKVVNLRERMESCSYGELLMEPYEGTTATGIAITNGVVQLNMNLNVKGRTRDSVTTDVENALEEYLGDLPNQFDHVILCLPPGTGGNWVASATVGGWRSVFNDGVCNLTEIQVHELGHNLGLNHASEEGDRKPEYGDYTGTMGGVYSDDPKFCFNPAKSWQLGWYSLRHISLDFTSRGSFRGQLIGIDDYQDPNAAGKYVNIKIIRPGSKNAIYVGFNLAAGINLNTDEAPNLVTIQTQTGSDNSWLVAKLALGQNHTIANFIDGKTLFIDVRSITMNSSLPVADVDIYLGSFAECQVNSDCTRGDACAVGTCQPGRICSYDTSACSGNFVLKLNTDTYPEETSWQVEDLCKGQVVLSKASYKSRDTLITETGILGMSQFRFTLFDSHGDGLCCGSQGPTELNVSFNGFQVGTFRDDFGSSVSLLFGASTCGSPPTPPPSIPPTAKPTAFPTLPPTTKPTMPPTPTPTAKPTVPPTPRPTLPPTRPPTAKPTVPPTRLPTAKPTVPPTPQPTLPPTAKPTVLPTSPPTPPPTAKPTAPPTPPPTLTPVGNPVMFLTDVSNNPGPGFPLQECHGDCDSDADCQGDLVCFERNDSRAVPGCSGTGISAWDYCYKYHSIHGPLVFKGSNPTMKLSACEGDCDSDSDCSPDLFCYQRGSGLVPGCEGIGFDGSDFCYDPRQGLAIGSDGNFIMELETDDYPEETTWQVQDVCNGNAVVLSGGPYTAANTIIRETGILGTSNYALYLYDSYGDGLCCGTDGATWFSVTLDGATIVSQTTFDDAVKVVGFGGICP